MNRRRPDSQPAAMGINARTRDRRAFGPEMVAEERGERLVRALGRWADDDVGTRRQAGPQQIQDQVAAGRPGSIQLLVVVAPATKTSPGCRLLAMDHWCDRGGQPGRRSRSGQDRSLDLPARRGAQGRGQPLRTSPTPRQPDVTNRQGTRPLAAETACRRSLPTVREEAARAPSPHGGGCGQTCDRPRPPGGRRSRSASSGSVGTASPAIWPRERGSGLPGTGAGAGCRSRSRREPRGSRFRGDGNRGRDGQECGGTDRCQARPTRSNADGAPDALDAVGRAPQHTPDPPPRGSEVR